MNLSIMNMSFIIEEIEKELSFLDIKREKSIIVKSAEYIYEIIKANQNMNLVANNNDLIKKHFLDSLMLLKFKELNREKILDMGTGAGFPGLPIKIFRPDIELHLIDSNRKKINFIRFTAYKINIKDIYTINRRIEDFAQDKEYSELFDIVLSRAVTKAAKIIEWAGPLLKENGEVILYKGPAFYNENEKKNCERDDKIIIKREELYELSGNEKRLLVFFKKKNL